MTMTNGHDGSPGTAVAPRIVWERDSFRLVALRQGEDLKQPELFHYEAMIQRDGTWRWCGDSREERAVLRAVAAWMDETQRKQAAQDAALRRMTALADDAGQYT